MSKTEPEYISHFETPQPLNNLWRVNFIMEEYDELDFCHCGKNKIRQKTWLVRYFIFPIKYTYHKVLVAFGGCLAEKQIDGKGEKETIEDVWVKLFGTLRSLAQLESIWSKDKDLATNQPTLDLWLKNILLCQ